MNLPEDVSKKMTIQQYMKLRQELGEMKKIKAGMRQALNAIHIAARKKRRKKKR